MAHVSLSLLGPVQVTLDGNPVTGFRYDKVRALLIYLAVERARPHRREALTGLFWPDIPEDAARTNLRQALATLRVAIDDRAADPPFLLISRESIQWNPEADAWLDVAELRGLIEASAHHTHRHPTPCKACTQRLEQAVQLYQGDFLAQFFLPDSAAFEEWAALQRETLQQQALGALAQLIQYYAQRGDYERAGMHARRYLALQPWSEEVHRQLMRLLVLQDQRSAAMAQYEHCRNALAEELGVEPEPETTALYERIRDQSPATQIGVDDLAFSTPRQNNLPPQLTPFVGREAELAQISAILDDPACRLLTLTGAGGIGKTRLAIQAAMQLAETFADGVCFVPLAGLGTPALIPAAIASALQISSAEGDLETQLFRHLQDKEMLLVLDDFEHLVKGASLLNKILNRAADVTILVTSRERLKLQGEWVFEVPGLALPASDQVGQLEDYGAIELFVRTARRVRPGFAPAEAEMPVLVRICRLLDGIPLAIELAAAWARLLSVDEIAREIEADTDFLTSQMQDTPGRHLSIRAVFDHSWELLSREERQVFQRLAVFRGGFHRQAAEAVAGARLPLLEALLDKSLIGRESSGRYRCHELARQYGYQKLCEAGEAELAKKRHLDYYIELAETVQPQLEGEQGALWLQRLEEEHDNLRAALEWSLHGGPPEDGLRLAAALFRFWYWHNHHLQEGSQWLEALLDATSRQDLPVPAALRAGALHAAGVLAIEQGRAGRAESHFEKSLALRRALGDTRGQAASLNSLGAVAWERQDYVAAQALFSESLELRRRIEKRETLSIPLTNLGKAAQALGDHERAQALFEESLSIDREFQNRGGIAIGLGCLGWIHLYRGEPASARQLFLESLALRTALDDQDGIAYCMEGLAAVAAVPEAAPGMARLAACLFGAAAALREAIHSPLSVPETAELADSIAQARRCLGEDAYRMAWMEGQGMELNAVLARIRQAFKGPGGPDHAG